MSQTNSPTWVGEQFISKYYDVLEKLPKYLHRFYKEDSTFSVANVQPDGTIVVETANGALEDIQEKVLGRFANAVVASDKSLDAQFSQGNGVLLQVSGRMIVQGLDRKFVQTFFLATQEKGYYVLNDMLRIFPPEPVRDLRPLENGFAAPHVPIPPPPFGLALAQIPAQLPPRVDVTSGMAAGIPLAPAVPDPVPAAEPEAVAQDKPFPVPAAVPEPAAVQQTALPEPAPAVAAAILAPPPVLPPAPVAPAPAKPAAPQQAPPVPAAFSTAAPQLPPNLSWAERAKLASAAPAASSSVSKPATPAKAVQQAIVASAPEASAPEAFTTAPIAPVGEAAGNAYSQPDQEADAKVPEILPPVTSGGDSDPGLGVYVQGLPQHLLPEEAKKLDAKSRDAALGSSGKLRLADGDKPVKVQVALPEFERGFAQRPGGRGDRGRGIGVGSGYRGGRGFDSGRGRGRGEGGRGEGGRGERPMGGRGGRGGERSGRGGPGRGPRDPNSIPAGPKPV